MGGGNNTVGAVEGADSQVACGPGPAVFRSDNGGYLDNAGDDHFADTISDGVGSGYDCPAGTGGENLSGRKGKIAGSGRMDRQTGKKGLNDYERRNAGNDPEVRSGG